MAVLSIILVAYSTVPASAVVSLLKSEYDLPEPLNVSLLRRGFNDNYVVTAGERRYVFRLYLHEKYWIRGEGDVRFELEMLAHLAQQGIGVSTAVARRGGDLLGTVEAPEGLRCYALFTWAPGAVPEPFTPEHGRVLGSALARVHRAADQFVSAHSRYSLDFGMLLDEPLRRMRPYLGADFGFVESVATRARALISAAEFPADGWGYIHADVHGGNSHFAENGQVTLFDFDHGGFGWRAYDLSGFVGAEPDEKEQAFLAGYESVRPLAPAERETLPAFAAARAIWDAGDMFAMTGLWGDAWAPRRVSGLLESLRAVAPKLGVQG